MKLCIIPLVKTVDVLNFFSNFDTSTTQRISDTFLKKKKKKKKKSEKKNKQEGDG
jgi:hypothetical protein